MSDEKNVNEVENIKLGDAEFAPDELETLVGAGKRLKELEEKAGQPIDDIMSSWGRRGEVIGDQKKQIEELAKKVEELGKPQGSEENGPSQEDVVAAAKEMGLLTMEDAEKVMMEVYNKNRSAEKLLSQSERVIKRAAKEGKPEVTVDKLLEFMSDPANPKDPQNAYDIMFKGELREWEQKRLESLKPKGMDTLEGAPSSKEPEPKTISSSDALKEALREHFSAS